MPLGWDLVGTEPTGLEEIKKALLGHVLEKGQRLFRRTHKRKGYGFENDLKPIENRTGQAGTKKALFSQILEKGRRRISIPDKG